MSKEQFTINLTNLDKIQSIKDLVENEINSGNLKVLGEQWISKYNKHIVYDYEPFCTAGFNYVLIVEGDSTYIPFFNKLFNDTAERFIRLERIFGTTERELDRIIGVN